MIRVEHLSRHMSTIFGLQLPRETSTPERVIFRGRGTALMIAGVFGSLLALPAIVVAATLPMPWAVVVSVAVLLLFVYPLMRGLRIALEITPETVTIVNYFRRYEIPWPEIALVGVGAGSMLAVSGDGITIRLRRDGREILCQASVSSGEQRALMLDALRRFGEPWGVPVHGKERRMH